jgi:hypothetical protein
MSMFCLIALIDIKMRRHDCAIGPMKCNQIMLDSILLARAHFYWLLKRNEWLDKSNSGRTHSPISVP